MTDQPITETIALPARWECGHGVADDEPFCAEAEDEDHVCPTIRVHPADAEQFAALVDEAHRLRTDLAPYEMLAPQQCPAGKHADWLVDSEYSHACPWCRIAELEEARRLEWQMGQARNPHTPRLCECGHSHFAHTVPDPHSCFALAQTCPCKAYRQLPHDEAVAQLKRNQQAAAERAAATAPDPICDDENDGDWCEPAAVPAAGGAGE